MACEGLKLKTVPFGMVMMVAAPRLGSFFNTLRGRCPSTAANWYLTADPGAGVLARPPNKYSVTYVNFFCVPGRTRISEVRVSS
jgi:hypothetical protein